VAGDSEEAESPLLQHRALLLWAQRPCGHGSHTSTAFTAAATPSAADAADTSVVEDKAALWSEEEESIWAVGQVPDDTSNCLTLKVLLQLVLTTSLG